MNTVYKGFRGCGFRGLGLLRIMVGLRNYLAHCSCVSEVGNGLFGWLEAHSFVFGMFMNACTVSVSVSQRKDPLPLLGSRADGRCVLNRHECLSYLMTLGCVTISNPPSKLVPVPLG